MNRLFVIKGEKVLYKELACVIIRVVNISTVSVEEIETNIIHTVSINNISPYEEIKENDYSSQIHSLSEKEWKKAKYRYEVIKDILKNKGNLKIIKDKSTEYKVSVPTIYRWIKLYESTGLVSSLAGRKRTGGIGKSRLSKMQDDIINDKIHSVYLTSSRKSINKTIREIKISCKELSINPPHSNTVRNRIKNLSEEERIRKRIGAQEAKYKFEPMKGHFPGADFPLSVVQIDHTVVDIILVDEHYRKAYKRPWLTVAIDVYSRMVVGFYLSFESPGALGTGICISNAILPKEMWLESVGVNSEWPCWGIMDTIHVDNAKEFRGNMLKKTCQNYGINIQFRPIGATHWGGHVERLLGTFSKEIHDLPGTTFSSSAERKNYKSEKNASFTLKEFEKWLTVYITNIYHKRDHSSISKSPLDKYKEGVIGNSNFPGKGIPPRINNERKTRIDFMPYVERTIQEYGIVIDHIFYYSDILRPYIHDTKDKIKVKHLFKRDPRDISLVYFYNPKIEDYFEIPYRNTSFPPISIWECRDIVSTLKKNNLTISEDVIFSTYRELDEMERKAIRETKKRRRFKKADLSDYSEVKETEILLNDVLPNNEIILPFEDLEDEAFRK
jgi:putative transposase